MSVAARVEAAKAAVKGKREEVSGWAEAAAVALCLVCCVAVAALIVAIVAATQSPEEHHHHQYKPKTLVVPLLATSEEGSGWWRAGAVGGGYLPLVIETEDVNMVFQRTHDGPASLGLRVGNHTSTKVVTLTLPPGTSLLDLSFANVPEVSEFLGPCSGSFGSVPFFVRNFPLADAAGLLEFSNPTLNMYSAIGGNTYLSTWPAGTARIPLFSLSYAAPNICE